MAGADTNSSASSAVGQTLNFGANTIFNFSSPGGGTGFDGQQTADTSTSAKASTSVGTPGESGYSTNGSLFSQPGKINLWELGLILIAAFFAWRTVFRK